VLHAAPILSVPNGGDQAALGAAGVEAPFERITWNQFRSRENPKHSNFGDEVPRRAIRLHAWGEKRFAARSPKRATTKRRGMSITSARSR